MTVENGEKMYRIPFDKNVRMIFCKVELSHHDVEFMHKRKKIKQEFMKAIHEEQNMKLLMKNYGSGLTIPEEST